MALYSVSAQSGTSLGASEYPSKNYLWGGWGSRDSLDSGDFPFWTGFIKEIMFTIHWMTELRKGLMPTLVFSPLDDGCFESFWIFLLPPSPGHWSSWMQPHLGGQAGALDPCWGAGWLPSVLALPCELVCLWEDGLWWRKSLPGPKWTHVHLPPSFWNTHPCPEV